MTAIFVSWRHTTADLEDEMVWYIASRLAAEFKPRAFQMAKQTSEESIITERLFTRCRLGDNRA
jgi:hypothetical protein